MTPLHRLRDTITTQNVFLTRVPRANIILRKLVLSSWFILAE
jgi:hypothetical protein